MAFFNLLVHWLALIAPAWAIALIFVSLARLAFWRSNWYFPWGINVLANGLLGCVCIGLALLIQGEDGSLLSYASLVIANASLQLALLRSR